MPEPARKPARSSKQPPRGTARVIGGTPKSVARAALPIAVGPAVKLSYNKAANDPRFKKVIDKLQKSAARTRHHPPPGTKAAEAQAAALPPANEKLAGAKATQVGVMDKAETGKPQQSSFLAMLRAEIEKVIPKKTAGAKDFMKGDDKQQLKGAMTGNVAQQKEEAVGGVKAASNQPPNTGAVPGKEVTPIPDEAPPYAPPVGAGDAMPAPRPASEVSLDQGKKDADKALTDNDLSQQQLQDANDSRFGRVITAKQQVDTQAQTLPQKYRSDEKGVIAGEAAKAVNDEKKGLAAFRGQKKKSGAAVKLRQLTAKEKDELRRKEVAKKIEAIFDATKASVDKKLASLEKDVGDIFDAGTEAALKKMRDYVDERFDDRYSGIRGKARWLKDKFVTLPDKVKAWFDQARTVFIEELDKLVVRVANLVENRLKEAKQEIAKGEKEVSNYVASLPEDLKAVGKAAQKEVASQFEELKAGVEDKKQDLAQNLAQRYKQATEKGDAALKEMVDAHKSLVEKVKQFVSEVVEVLRNFKNRLLSMIKKAASAIGLIVRHPIKFLENLLSAIKLGLRQFVDRIWDHLREGFLQWLLGPLGEAGITLPKDLSLPSILSLVLQVLGLTYDRIRAKAVKLIGERNVALIEKAFELLKALWDGGPAALWEKFKEYVGDLKQQVIDAIQEWVITTIIKAAVTKIATMFNPVGAIIQAILTIYNTVMFLIENINRILDFVEAVFDSIYKIATGAVGEAANWIEKALARAIPIMIAFLARLLGISGVTDKIVRTIKKIQAKVDQAVDKVIAKVVAGIGKVFATGKKLVKQTAEKVKSFLFPPLPFAEADGKTHTLTVDTTAPKGELIVQSSPSSVANYLYKLKPKVDSIKNKTKKKQAQTAYTDALAQRQKAADTLAAVFDPQSGRTKSEQELFKETNILLGLIKKMWSLIGVGDDLLEGEAEVGTYSELGTDPDMTAHHVPQNAILKRLRRWITAYLDREPVPGFREYMSQRLAGLGVKHGEVRGYADSQGISIRTEKLRHNQTRTFGKLPEDLDVPQGEWSIKGKKAGDERIKRFVDIARSEFEKDTEDVFAIYSGRKGLPKVTNIQKVTAGVQKLKEKNAAKWGTFLR